MKKITTETEITTESFFARLRSNGDLWIMSRVKAGRLVPVATKDGAIIMIPANDCQELADLLRPKQKNRHQ